MGWICSLCQTESEYSDGGSARYLGGAEFRSLLDELQGNTVDLDFDDIRENMEDENSSVTPLTWAVIDVTCDPETLNAVKEGLLTAVETMPQYHHFGLSLFDEQYLYIMNWKSGKFHRLPHQGECVQHGMYDGVVYLDVVQPVSEVQEAATTIISLLEPKPTEVCQENRFLQAVEISLKYIFRLVANAAQVHEPPTHLNGRPLGSRLLLFLSTPLNELNSDAPMNEQKNNIQSNQGFYLDSLNPELVMVEPRCISNERNSSTRETQKIFTNAGATSAVLGIAVNVFLMGPCNINISVISPLSQLSGGTLSVYDSKYEGFAEDLYKIMNRVEYLDCSIKVRSSAEIIVADSTHYRLKEDRHDPDVLQIPRASKMYGFGFLFDHIDGFGSSRRAPPCIQIAIAFTLLIPHTKYSCVRAHRYLRVITQEYPLAKSVTDVLPYDDTDVQLYFEFKSCMYLLESYGKEKAVTSLRQGLQRRIDAHNACMHDPEYIELEESLKNQESKNFSTIISCMKNLIHIIKSETENSRKRFNLLQSIHASNCSCDEVGAAILPRLSFWSADGKAWLWMSTCDSFEPFDSPVCLLDTCDLLVLYKTSTDSQIDSSSKLMKHVAACRRSRIPTPIFVLGQTCPTMESLPNTLAEKYIFTTYE